MDYDIGDLLVQLPRIDATSETSNRIRRQACAMLRDGRTVRGRTRIRLRRIYTRLLEPVLLLATAALSISWAISRMMYITGAH